MSRIEPLEHTAAGADMQAEYDRIAAVQGRMTNMKRTLAHEPVAMEALLRWYPLRDVVQPFLGERLTTIYVHAISTATDCLICSTFFRRILIDSGEDPSALQLDDREQAVVDFGRQMVQDANAVSDELYARLTRHFSPREIVALTAFGGVMIATNIFNNALQVDLDEELYDYRADDR